MACLFFFELAFEVVELLVDLFNLFIDYFDLDVAWALVLNHNTQLCLLALEAKVLILNLLF